MLGKEIKITGFADEIGEDFDLQLTVLKELGMSYIELRSAYGKNIAEYSVEEAKGLKEKMDACGIQVSAIGSPIGKIGVNDDFEVHFEVYKNVVELAKLFKTSYIRMFSFYVEEGDDFSKYTASIIEKLIRLRDYAAENNITLLLENEKGVYGDNAVRSKELLEVLYNENFKAAFDPANFVQCNQDVIEAYEMLKPYIGYFHMKDALFGTHQVVLLGAGEGRIAELLEKAKEDNIVQFYSLEPHLTEFIGLDSLEREGEESKIGSIYQDGREAFMASYKALISLLNK